MVDVFLSYKSEERRLVEPIASALQSIGLSVWYDAQIQVGSLFDEQIDHELRTSRSVLVCWSNKSVNSQWVLREATVADLGNTIVPVFLDDVAPPGPFARREGARLAGWFGDLDHPEWLLLLESIQRILGRDDLIAKSRSLAGSPDRRPQVGHFREERQFRRRRRLLALDGAGPRAVLELEWLARIEAALRERHGSSELVLADYFDLIGGTSVSAYIASMLAVGKSVAMVTDTIQRDVGRWYKGSDGGGLFSRSKFESRRADADLSREFGDLQFNDKTIKTGLALCLKSLGSSRPFVITNNPFPTYWERNKSYYLRDVVLACIAEPGSVRPVSVRVGGEKAYFVDGMYGGLTNPALELLQTVVDPIHGLNWPLSTETTLVLSIGAGQWRVGFGDRRQDRYGGYAAMAHSMALDTVNSVERTMALIGDGGENKGGVHSPYIKYRRLDVRLDGAAIAELLSVDPRVAQSIASKVTGYSEYLNSGALRDLSRIGQAAASKVKYEEILPIEFDLLYEN